MDILFLSHPIICHTGHYTLNVFFLSISFKYFVIVFNVFILSFFRYNMFRLQVSALADTTNLKHF